VARLSSTPSAVQLIFDFFRKKIKGLGGFGQAHPTAEQDNERGPERQDDEDLEDPAQDQTRFADGLGQDSIG
jgi:hypothetical protein